MQVKAKQLLGDQNFKSRGKKEKLQDSFFICLTFLQIIMILFDLAQESLKYIESSINYLQFEHCSMNKIFFRNRKIHSADNLLLRF